MPGKLMGSALVLLAALAHTTLMAQDPGAETPEEIVVVGRVPGPPLWKASNGEHVLWIFPQIGFIPKNMQWESTRVEKLIAESQEYIALPRGGYAVTISKNPFNLVRAFSLYNKDIHLPKGKTLADVLPPAYYQRFSALKAKYFPNNKAIERLAPRQAGSDLGIAVLAHEKLAGPLPVIERIGKLVKRNKAIKITDPSYFVTDTVKFSEMKTMVTQDTDEHALALQTECLQKQISYIEEELPLLKRRANAWAQGYADDLVAETKQGQESSPCGFSTLNEKVQEVDTVRQQNWLAAAEAALANNSSTFAMLGINDILGPNALVERLKAQGYAVTVSAK